MNLVQAKPLSHKLSVMEYKSDKIKDSISQTSHILWSDDVLLSYKSQSKAILFLFIPLLVILLWDCVWH